MTHTKRRFGLYVRHRRNLAGLQQQQLARRARLHGAHVSRIESGGADPQLATLVRLAKGFGESVEVFLAAYALYDPRFHEVTPSELPGNKPRSTT